MILQEYYRAFRIHIAFKATLAAGICAAIGILFHLSYGYLAPLATILVLVVFRGQVIQAGLPGYLAILVAGSAALVISALLHESPIAYVASMLALLFFWMVYLRPIPLGHVLGGILIAMILFTVALGTGKASDLLSGFWTQVLIAIVIAGFVDRLLWPSDPAEARAETLAALFEQFARDADGFGRAVRTGETAAPGFMAELAHIAHLSHFPRPEGGRTGQADLELNLRCRLIWDRLRGLARHMESGAFNALSAKQASLAAETMADFARHFREMSKAALERRPAPGVAAQTAANVETVVAQLRTSDGQQAAPDPGLSFSAATVARFLRQALDDHDALARAYNATLMGKTGGSEDAAPPDAPPALIARPDAGAVRTSAKLTLIVVVLLVGVLYLDFPGSSLVAFYGITFGLMTNLGQLHMKGKAGVLGIFGALAYGVFSVLVLVQAPHFLVLLGLFSLGVFVAAYLSAGDETVTFLGLQAALVMPYIFLIFEGPVWTLENSITRAFALAISAAAAIVIQSLIWPVDPSRLFRQVAMKALHDLSRRWETLWAREGDGAIPPEAGLPDVSEALILDFDQGAALLNDSRYLFGSDHPRVHAYLRLLRALEELFGEMRILKRLIGSGRDAAMLRDAIDHLRQPIENISDSFTAIADHLRHGTGHDALSEIDRQLRFVHDLPDDLDTILARHPSAAFEERRKMAFLLETVRNVAATLREAIDAARVIVPAREGGGRTRGVQKPAPS